MVMCTEISVLDKSLLYILITYQHNIHFTYEQITYTNYTTMPIQKHMNKLRIIYTVKYQLLCYVYTNTWQPACGGYAFHPRSDFSPTDPWCAS